MHVVGCGGPAGIVQDVNMIIGDHRGTMLIYSVRPQTMAWDDITQWNVAVAGYCIVTGKRSWPSDLNALDS